jgi:hypothetical protein
MNEKQTMNKEVKKADEVARQAWRGWVIPAVGSMAFFASMILNGVKNYRTYGFPTHVFNRTDWVLLSLPFIVMGVALSDVIKVPSKEDKK